MAKPTFAGAAALTLLAMQATAEARPFDRAAVAAAMAEVRTHDRPSDRITDPAAGYHGRDPLGAAPRASRKR